MRRTTTMSVVALTAVAMLAGCGSSKKAADTTTPPTSAAAATSAASDSSAPAGTDASGTPADAATTAAITTAFEGFFDPATPQATKLTYLEDADKLTSLIATLNANPSSKKTSAKVKSVLLIDATHATVIYDLSSAGAVVLPGSHGKAVKVGAQWKVSKDTFCALASLAVTNGQLPGCA